RSGFGSNSVFMLSCSPELMQVSAVGHINVLLSSFRFKKLQTESRRAELISVVSERNCSSCQKRWYHSQSSCYSVNNAEPLNQKTWEEAREICRGKISDLTVVGDEEEKVKTEL
uniref:C-type lectin domain-containing protein n=1 Tax=Fundulus heteroclitus TaxID=8078 RepID=A0A3Q2SZ08_FUNHE